MQTSSLADALGLAATGGTDFHGKNRPKIKLGSGHGGLDIPHEVFERLVSVHEGLTDKRPHLTIVPKDAVNDL